MLEIDHSMRSRFRPRPKLAYEETVSITHDTLMSQNWDSIMLCIIMRMSRNLICRVCIISTLGI